MLVEAVGTLISIVQTVGLVRATGVVRATSSSEEEERPGHKRHHRAAPAARCHLPSVVPYSPYVDSIKEDDITVVINNNKGIKISNSLGKDKEVNNSKE